MTSKIRYSFRAFDFRKDIKMVCEFHKEHIKINFPGSLYKERLFKERIREAYKKEPKGMFVLEHRKGIIGFLWLQTAFDVYKDSFYGDVHYVHVAPEYRGMGLGHALMEKVNEYFRDKSVRDFRLGTHVDNRVAIRLYKKFGFRKYRIIMIKEL